MASGQWVAQRCCSSGKCRLKPRWGVTSRLSEWLSSKNPRAMGAGEDMELGWQIGAATVASSWEAPRKITNGAATWPSSRTSGYLSDEIQDTNSKRCMCPCVHCRQHYWQWPGGHGGSPGVLRWTVGERCGAYTRWSVWLGQREE